MGTAEWMAPEVMRETSAVYGPSADIFSFSIIMWEMWSREKPWREYSTDTSIIFDRVRDGDRLKISHIKDIAPRGYEDLMKRCWNHDQKDRPLIDTVQTNISRMMNARAEEVRSRFNHTRYSSHARADEESDHSFKTRNSSHDSNVPTLSTQGFASPVHRTRSADDVFWTQNSFNKTPKGMQSRRFSATPVMRTTGGLGKKGDSNSSLVSIDIGPSAVIDRRCSGGVEMTDMKSLEEGGSVDLYQSNVSARSSFFNNGIDLMSSDEK